MRLPSAIAWLAVVSACGTTAPRRPAGDSATPAENPPDVRIRIVAGTYGASCGQPRGNVTRHLAEMCNGSKQCAYRIHHLVIGDPAFGCRKDYIAEWTCAGSSQRHRAYASPEAGFGSILRIGCPADAAVELPPETTETPAPKIAEPLPPRPPPPLTEDAPPPPLPSAAQSIHVVAGSYGANCEAPRGNVTAHLAEKCDGRRECGYRIHHWIIGDPAYGCRKSYVAEWTCGKESQVRQSVASPEAGYGSVVYLSCDPAARPRPLASEGPRAAHGPIRVHSASYGQHCTRDDAAGTAELARTCDERWICEYTVPFGSAKDPGRNCGEDYVAQWTCGDDPDPQSVHVPANAGPGALVVLHCP